MEMVGYLRNAHREDWHTELAVAATLSYLSRHRMVLLHLDANKLKSSRRAPALLFFRCWLRINDDAGCGDGTITAKNCLFFALVACYIKKNCTFARQFLIRAARKGVLNCT
jgi:hypothetical protein